MPTIDFPHLHDSKQMIAPDYSTSSTYNVGDYVVYNRHLYQCNTAISIAEAWTAAHWTQLTVADALESATNPPESAYDVVATITCDLNTTTQETTWTCDKTFDEVSTALSDGKRVMFKYDESEDGFVYWHDTFDQDVYYDDSINQIHMSSYTFSPEYTSTHTLKVTVSVILWTKGTSGNPDTFGYGTGSDALYLSANYTGMTRVISATLTPSSYSVTASLPTGMIASQFVYMYHIITSGSESYFTSPVTITPTNNSYTFTVATATAPTASVSMDIYMTKVYNYVS